MAECTGKIHAFLKKATAKETFDKIQKFFNTSETTHEMCTLSVVDSRMRGLGLTEEELEVINKLVKECMIGLDEFFYAGNHDTVKLLKEIEAVVGKINRFGRPVGESVEVVFWAYFVQNFYRSRNLVFHHRFPFTVKQGNQIVVFEVFFLQ